MEGVLKIERNTERAAEEIIAEGKNLPRLKRWDRSCVVVLPHTGKQASTSAPESEQKKSRVRSGRAVTLLFAFESNRKFKFENRLIQSVENLD